MRNKSALVAILALLISCGAVGFIIYDQYFVQPPTKDWFANYPYSVAVSSGEAWSTIPWVAINFTVGSGESVYLLFTGITRFDDSSGDTYMEICFVVDHVRWSEPLCRIECYTTGSGDIWRMSVAMQCVNSSLPPGIHNVFISFRGNHTLDSLREMALFVHTF
jgi:hypothetical protein